MAKKLTERSAVVDIPKPKHASSYWTVPITEKLVELWRKGYSAGKIAMLLNNEVTRNAVIGKIHRLGLSADSGLRKQRRKAEASTALYGNKRSKSKPGASSLRWNRMAPSEAIKFEPIPEGRFVELDIPLSQRRTIDTVEKGECRWPIGDPQHKDFHLCGAKAIPSQPYCVYHKNASLRENQGPSLRRYKKRVPPFYVPVQSPKLDEDESV